MSFMSFDYAMRAADAALQFQQSQGSNIKDTNARVREVGTGNAKRKDDLVRQTIEAEYDAKSADIKKEKAEKLAKLALERKQSAMLTTMLIGGASLVGGMLDGIVDLAKGDPNKVPDSEQMQVDGDDAVKNGYATSFKLANGVQNSESGAMVAFSQSKGEFSLVKMNTTTGKPDGFVNMSATDMASHILDTCKNNSSPEAGRLRAMIDQGPPPMFKAEHFSQKDGKYEMSPALKTDLFGGPNGAPAGFFAAGSRVGASMQGNDQQLKVADNEKRQAGLASNILRDLDGDTSENATKLKGMINPGTPASFKDANSPELQESLKQCGLEGGSFSAPDVLKKLDGDNSPAAERVRSMINPGVAPAFKPEFVQGDGTGGNKVSPDLDMALRSFPKYEIPARALATEGRPVGDEAGENMIAGLLKNPAAISKAYGPTAESVMSMLKNDQIRGGLQMSKENVDKTHDSFKDAGVLKSGWDTAGNIAQKTLFKPLGSALPQFMELMKVAKEYDDEYKQKMVEAQTARQQAAAAREKLHKLQSLLAAGSSG